MMAKSWKVRICTVLLLLNLCFIWGNSLMPAEISQEFSDWVQLLLEAEAENSTAASNSGVLRKFAHFAEFTTLGMLLYWQVCLRRGAHWLAPVTGLAAACVDESIQSVVPGRSPALLDVGIDSLGVLTGIILMKLGYVLIKRIQRKLYGG